MLLSSLENFWTLNFQKNVGVKGRKGDKEIYKKFRFLNKIGLRHKERIFNTSIILKEENSKRRTVFIIFDRKNKEAGISLKIIDRKNFYKNITNVEINNANTLLIIFFQELFFLQEQKIINSKSFISLIL